MAAVTRFVLSNFTLTFLILGLIASGIVLLRAPKPLTAPVAVEALFAYFLLFSIGFSFLYLRDAHHFRRNDGPLHRLAAQPIPG
jgi:uncharacterized membrane protein